MDSYIQFKKGLEKHIQKTFASLLRKSEAEEQAVISKHLELQSRQSSRERIGYEILLKVPKINKRTDILKYAILSWYLDPWTRFELQEFLRKKCKQLKNFDIELLYLYSKELCIFSLFRENDCRYNQLFGNILQDEIYENHYISSQAGLRKRRLKKRNFCYLIISFRKEPKKKVFRRGYNDKGSLPPNPREKYARSLANMELPNLLNELEINKLQLQAKNRQLELLFEMKRKGVAS